LRRTGSQPGHSCNFWENYEADLQRNVDMGCTSMRFSLEWHRIEPQRGQISSDAIAHFHKILDVMDRCVLPFAQVLRGFTWDITTMPRLPIGGLSAVDSTKDTCQMLCLRDCW